MPAPAPRDSDGGDENAAARRTRDRDYLFSRFGWFWDRRAEIFNTPEIYGIYPLFSGLSPRLRRRRPAEPRDALLPLAHGTMARRVSRVREHGAHILRRRQPPLRHEPLGGALHILRRRRRGQRRKIPRALAARESAHRRSRARKTPLRRTIRTAGGKSRARTSARYRAAGAGTTTKKAKRNSNRRRASAEKGGRPNGCARSKTSEKAAKR